MRVMTDTSDCNVRAQSEEMGWDTWPLWPQSVVVPLSLAESAGLWRGPICPPTAKKIPLTARHAPRTLGCYTFGQRTTTAKWHGGRKRTGGASFAEMEAKKDAKEKKKDPATAQEDRNAKPHTPTNYLSTTDQLLSSSSKCSAQKWPWSSVGSTVLSAPP